MEKIVDLLTLTYRAMLLLCATLFLLIHASSEDQSPYTHKLKEIDELQRAHVEVIGAVEQQTRDFYRKQFEDKGIALTKAQKSLLAHSRFGSGKLHLIAPAPFPREPKVVEEDIPLDGGDITLNELLQLFDFSMPGVKVQLPLYTLNKQELRSIAPQLLDEADAAFVAGKGFIKVAEQPVTGKCIVSLGPFSSSEEKDLRFGLPITCKQELEPLQFTGDQFGFTTGIEFRSIFYGDPYLGPFPVAHASAELRPLAAGEATRSAADEIDVLGLKVSKSYLRDIGPICLAILFVQLIIYGLMARRLVLRPETMGIEPSEMRGGALPWFGQFRGLPAWITFAVSVGFPFWICGELASLQTAYQPIGSAANHHWLLRLGLPAIFFLGFYIQNLVLAHKLYAVTPAPAPLTNFDDSIIS